jgi:two-component system NtrC family response regulator/two-component system response regulator HydG
MVMPRERILVVDGEPKARAALSGLLTREGYEVSEASAGEEALARLPELLPALVIADLSSPSVDGINLMKRAKDELHCDSAFVMTSASPKIEVAVEAMQAGAESCLVEPLEARQALLTVERALQKVRLQRDAANLRERVKERARLGSLIGESSELQAAFDVVRAAAPTAATVLVLGESGTGKDLVAQALHELSPRKAGPFIKVSCAALPETLLESELFGHERGAFTGATASRQGRFELADGGTLFLDEIGEVPLPIQAKLLRALQAREFERVGGTQTLHVDVRVVAATNRDLSEAVRQGRFREDLYYRLNVVAVTLPPLRRRKGDIPALAGHFLERAARSYGKDLRGLAPGTLKALVDYDWPGNVRELENALERAVVLCRGDSLTTDDLPPPIGGNRRNHEPAALIPGATLYEIEREAILRTLEIVGGSTSRAARLLGISVRKIQYRLKEYAGRDGANDVEEQARQVSH